VKIVDLERIEEIPKAINITNEVYTYEYYILQLYNLRRILILFKNNINDENIVMSVNGILDEINSKFITQFKCENAQNYNRAISEVEEYLNEEINNEFIKSITELISKYLKK
jgi:hypothetical protein